MKIKKFLLIIVIFFLMFGLTSYVYAETYKGYETIGTIEIPKINIKYPVLSKLSAKSLDTAPVAIFPQNPVLNTVGNVVITSHNYKNGTFFSNLKLLQNGDKIYITDLNSSKITYSVYKIQELSESDTSSYARDTNGYKEITLSTVTDAANDKRLVVFARETSDNTSESSANSASQSNSNDATPVDNSQSTTNTIDDDSDATTVTFLTEDQYKAELANASNSSYNTSNVSNSKKSNDSNLTKNNTNSDVKMLPYTGQKNIIIFLILFVSIVSGCIAFNLKKYKNV